MTAAMIASALGRQKRAITRRAASEGWAFQVATCRGGRLRLYCVDSLPTDIQAALQGELNAPSTAVETPPPEQTAEAGSRDKMSKTGPADEPASRWERLPESARSAAAAKLALVDEAVAISEREGISMRSACERVASGGASASASADALLRAWRSARDLPAPSRAAALADRRIGRGRPARACDEAAWEFFKSDYLRAEAPAASACLRRLERVAERQGWNCPRYAKYYLRRLEREVSPQAVALARQGPEALARMRPPQSRDREALDVMEALCADGHVFDVRVDFGGGETGRPVLVAWQDIRSGSIIGWRIGRSEDSAAYRLSLADALWKHGAPLHAIVDNGRGIASKRLTGGTPNRYRGKILPSDPVGLLTQLVGPEGIHWATPYSGQSKPIERAFRDLCEDVSRDPRLAGAYTGKDTLSKPHNYGRRAIPLERFREVAADGIREHNAREGRRGLGLEGRSFDAAFERGMAGHEPRKVSETELARWLFDARSVTARASDGAVSIHGNRYWSEELAAALAGKPKERRQVVVRYDPERLDRPVSVEDAEGRLFARAEPLGAVEFFDAQAAKRTAKAKAKLRKAARAELELHRQLEPAAVGKLLDEAAEPLPDAPPNLIEMDFPVPDADPDRDDEVELMRAAERRTLARALGGGDR